MAALHSSPALRARFQIRRLSINPSNRSGLGRLLDETLTPMPAPPPPDGGSRAPTPAAPRGWPLTHTVTAVASTVQARAAHTPGATAAGAMTSGTPRTLHQT